MDIQVEAPADLVEGYQFSAEAANGQIVPVTVPAGGVKQGQVFYAPVASAVETQLAVASSAGIKSRSIATTTEHVDGSHTYETQILDEQNGGSTIAKQQQYPPRTFGSWRFPICGCLDHCCFYSDWWMGWCCYPILLAQIMQRMGLDWLGRPTPDPSKTCMIVTTLFVSLMLLHIIFALVDNAAATTEGVGEYDSNNQDQEASYVYPADFSNLMGATFLLRIVASFGFLLIVILHACTRNAVRRRYHVPPNCCGAFGDYLCAKSCTCCSVVQMARHTHDETVHPYQCCSPTGLGPQAPPVVAMTV